MAEKDSSNLVELATELTVAWLANQHNRVTPDEVPTFLTTVHGKLSELSGGASSVSDSQPGQASEQAFTPAVSARKSLASRDHIISMIDGKPYKTLRRHLSRHGLTPEQYRERYKLKSDYPMVAEGYSEQRRETAKRLGLGGRKKANSAGSEAADAAPKRPAKAARGTRKKAATAI